MTLDEQRTWLELHYSACLAVFKSRERDYAPSGIALLNLLETAVENNHTVLDELWSLYKKQETAIRRYKNIRRLDSDSLAERVRDACNYLSLMAFYETNKDTIHQAWDSYWRQQPCSCLKGRPAHPLSLKEAAEMLDIELDDCTRCAHLWWLTRHSPVWLSPESRSILKAQD